MNIAYYDKIIELIGSSSLGRQELFDYMKASFQNDKDEKMARFFRKLSYKTFTSLYGNAKRRFIFKTHYWRKMKDNDLAFANKYKEYELKHQHDPRTNSIEDNLLIRMAREINLSPALMARLVLQGLAKTGDLEIKDVPRESLHKLSLSGIMKDTHLIMNGRLAKEVSECCVVDDEFGPCIDSIRHVIGIEYEIKLEERLNERKLFYVREDEMREKGFDKTPDILLELPICVDGKIISWIDSKASFGDESVHTENYEKQFKSYLNRFGSGLVIYWFGFVEGIESCHAFDSTKENRTILILDHFPIEFTMLEIDSLI